MTPPKQVMKWIRENFNSKEVEIESYSGLPYGKKVTDERADFVIVFYDFRREALNFLFKGQSYYFFEE